MYNTCKSHTIMYTIVDWGFGDSAAAAAAGGSGKALGCYAACPGPSAPPET